jgi:hypothetical protein
MSTYLISYDLSAPGRNYQPVYDYMQNFSDRMKPLQTVYLVHTSESAGTIRDELKGLVDSNDKVLVVEVDTLSWGTFNLPNTAKWLKEH